MKKIFVLIAAVCGLTAVSYAQPATHSDSEWLSYYATNWQPLLRPTLRNPVNVFYRFTIKNGVDKLELKVSLSGEQFLVARNAPLELEVGGMYCGNDVVTLYNEEYRKSCRGCGSRVKGGDMEGVTLYFPIDKEAMKKLDGKYIYHLRLKTGEDLWVGGCPKDARSELFRDIVTQYAEYTRQD